MDKWIKVDTEQLRAYAGGYKEHSETIGTSGEKPQNSILMVVSAMPDYDGRLQGAARPDALEIGMQCRTLSNEFMDDSNMLIRIAKAFEEVDGQTVKVIGDCQDTSSKACFIDQGGDPGLWIQPQTVTNPDGSITTTTSEVILNPDGSQSTVITVRTTYPDGTVKETKTIRTIKVIDSDTAAKWNQNAEDAKLYFTMAVAIALGFAADFYIVEALEATALAALAEALGFIADGTVETATEKLIDALGGASPDRGWQGGDTITNTITVETTYAPDGTPTQQQVTDTTVVTDNDGTVVSSETTGIDPTGAPKSGTPADTDH
jgi:hypothetical protein